ncbi:MAG: mandelate racemase/muconate lactonizing enzyme family protein [Thermomicrobiales bacterium]|nr:mandelate racemase/muconate lactonizing enzyme family protein [Thermomicrobiales bacterium]
MKITGIEVLPVWGGHRNYLFVIVDTDEGITGYGESGLTGRELAVSGVIDHLRPELIGQDPRRIEHLWQYIARSAFFPAEGAVGAALSAIDIALWDIKGKALGVPVYELLGGLVRDKVICYPHNAGHFMDADSLVESCRKTTEDGWKFVRWGLPQNALLFEPLESIKAAIKQFEAVREALGDDIEICFDIHTRLDLPDALYLCKEVEQYRPFFMEDPLRSEAPGAFAQLRGRTTVPLAAGEQFTSKYQFRELIENDWIDYCRIDLCLAGGITEARKVAGWCEAHYIKMAVHNPLGPVSSAACLQFNLATSNFAVQEQPRKPSEIIPDIAPVQPVWEDGYLLPPTAPGLGVEIDREAAKKHPFQMAMIPQLRRVDGSFTNW